MGLRSILNSDLVIYYFVEETHLEALVEVHEIQA